MERVKGIEPSYSAWKAAALPLSYTRVAITLSNGYKKFKVFHSASLCLLTMRGHRSVLSSINRCYVSEENVEINALAFLRKLDSKLDTVIERLDDLTARFGSLNQRISSIELNFALVSTDTARMD